MTIQQNIDWFVHLFPSCPNGALCPVVFGIFGVEEVKERCWKDEAQYPGGRHQTTGTFPAARKVHGVGDGIVPVNAEKSKTKFYKLPAAAKKFLGLK